MSLKIFLQIYLRSISRSKFQTIVQLIGLALGISVAILVFLFLQSELTYDRFHKDHNNIYKYGIQMQIGDSEPSSQFGSNPQAGPLLADYIPEIKRFTRSRSMGQVMVKNGTDVIYENNFRWMDSTGLEIFNFPLILGEASTALDAPYSIVISEDLSHKYFGSENPLGKTLELEDLGLFTVTGVVENPPTETDVFFSALLSFHTQYVDDPEVLSPTNLFGGMGTHIYFQVQKGFDQDKFEEKLKQFYKEHLAKVDMINYVSMVEPVKKIRLNSSITTRVAARNRGFFAGFLSIGIIVLILSIINYINLSTAGFMSRAREVAVKKTLGGLGKTITRQFLLESGLNSLIALIVGVSIAEIVLSFTQLNQLLDKDLSLSFLDNPVLLLGIAGLFLATAVMSGLYPAIFMSRTRPIQHLRGDMAKGLKSGKIRSMLLGFQFILSISAIVMILLMSKQISFMNNLDLGFDRNNLMFINTNGDQVREGLEAFRQDIESNTLVKSTSFSRVVPGIGASGNAFNWENNDGEMEIHAFQTMIVDRNFTSTLGVEIIQGTDFTKFEGSDSVRYFIVNKSLVDYMDWKDPVGMRNEYGEVIGVMKDINVQTARQEVRPGFLLLNNSPSSYLLVKLQEGEQRKAVEFIKSVWEKHYEGIPLNHDFVDQVLISGFERERNQQRLFIFLVIICVFLSGLGLLGVTAHLLTKKTKEVAIRKVYGASVFQVIIPLVKPILIVLSSAMIFSVPIVIFLYRSWLANYAFQISADPFIFIIVFIGIVLFAMTISSYHGLKVALAKPVDKIKYE